MSTSVRSSLDVIFNPRTVAIIGASNDASKWGYSLMERPLKTNFPGKVFPVNPRETTIMGLPAYPSILDIPDPVDLAVLTVPAASAVGVMEQCVQKGVRGAVVITAGFGETGAEGEALQRRLVETARRGGIRFVGPNCNGLWSASAGLSLFSPQAPKTGGIAFISQSGAWGSALVGAANARGYGVSRFVSTGNQADLNDADYLEYLADDPETKVVAFYMEGLRESRRFLEVARRTIRQKPVLVYKAGRTAVGARAVRSHSGSLAVPDAIFDTACRQNGIIRAGEAMHLFDMAAALAEAPLPQGNRVAIITLAGGQCVVTSDSCAYLGLEVPEIDAATQQRLKGMLALHAPAPRNPIDIAGDFRDVSLIAQVVDIVADLPYIDGLIVGAPSGGLSRTAADALADKVKATAESIASVPARTGKPVVAVGLPRTGPRVAWDIYREHQIPCYETPEDSARAMWALAQYATYRRELSG